MTMSALTPREASIFACLTDALVAPRPPLPPVRETDTVQAFDAWLARSPRPYRIGLRALLYAVELGSLASGFGARMRRLDRGERVNYVHGMERARLSQLRQLAKMVKAVSLLSYYGDDDVMRVVGYDAEVNLRRARKLRESEGRP